MTPNFSILAGQKADFIQRYIDAGFKSDYAENQWTVQGRPENIAYSEGYKVGNFSVTEHQNPFEQNSKEFDSWNNGFKDGRYDAPDYDH